MRVFKYQLPDLDPGVKFIQMPDKAPVIAFQEQGGILTIWATVRDHQDTVTRSFRLAFTGFDSVEDHAAFIGTVQHSNGLVYHLFEI